MANKTRKPTQADSVQAGTPRPQPARIPAQHLSPGEREADLELRPRFMAPDYRGSQKLQGRVALISAGDSGIGRAVAVLFAREGADVAIAFLSSTADAEETSRHVQAEGRRCLLLQGGVVDRAWCEQAVDRTVQSLGGLDNLMQRGIRVNAVAPGPVWTPLNPSDLPAGQVAQFGPKTDMKRPAQPEELSPAYVFLAVPCC